MQTGPQVFQEMKEKLIQSKLILNGSVDDLMICYLYQGQAQIYDLNSYYEDFLNLIIVFSYQSTDRYAFNRIPQIRDLVAQIKCSFSQHENSNKIDLEHNVEMQMFSKLFHLNGHRQRFIHYLYFTCFSEWMQSIQRQTNFLRDPPVLDEGNFYYSMRVIGQLRIFAFENRQQLEQ